MLNFPTHDCSFATNPICGMQSRNATSPQYHSNPNARPERAAIAPLRQSWYGIMTNSNIALQARAVDF